MVGSAIVNALQSIVSRNVDPLESAVVSITQFHAGTADNIIPQTGHLRGTARSLTPEMRDIVEQRVREVVEGTARLYGAKATLTYKRDYPVTRNHERQTAFAAEVASQVVGDERVDGDGAADDGGRGFLVHAGGAARRFHLHRQRRQRGSAPPGLQLQ